MKSISGKELCKIVKKKGWILRHIEGSHHIFEKEGSVATLSIPVHGNRDLKIGTLKNIMKLAKLTQDDLN